MPAVGITDAAGRVFVCRVEERGVGTDGGVFKQQAIDGSEDAIGLVDGAHHLAAHVGLEICHEQRGSNAFSGDIGEHESDVSPAEIEEVVIVAANRARLDANTGIVKARNRRLPLRKQSVIYRFVFGYGSGTCISTLVSPPYK
jgi:hypothetical protein